MRRCFPISLLLLCPALVPGWLAAQQLQEPQREQPAPQQETKQPPDPQARYKPRRTERLTLDKILKRLPGRVSSKDGKPGDMVNFLLIGPKEKMQAALKAAGWVPVDRTPEDAVLHALSDVLAKRAYEQMPMSELYLFGRPQDYGYASGIPIHIVTERDHFRLWQAAWLTRDGQAVWVGAGTHDISIEKTSQNGEFTHAIDPNVDQEREFIVQSLQDAAHVKELRYLTPPNPVERAFTATGDPFHSDGRIAVIFLK